MATRSTVRDFVRDVCQLDPSYTTPIGELVEAITHYAYEHSAQPPSKALVTAALLEYGVTRDGTGPAWVFVGIRMSGESCQSCNESYPRGDRASYYFHNAPQQCRPVCRRPGKPKCSHPNCRETVVL